MITGTYWSILDDVSIRKIEETAIRLLVKSGARIEHEDLLSMLEESGCSIDRAALRAYFSEDLVRNVMSRIGEKNPKPVRIPVGWNPQWHMAHVGSQPHILDWPSCERRLATRQDVTNMAKMAHVLDEFTLVGKVLTCNEIDQRIEPLWAVLQIARITNKKIVGGEIFFPGYIEPLIHMGEVLTGKTWDHSLISECDFFTQPLIFERKQAECFIEKRKWKIPNIPGSMVIAGVSGPVTLAGSTALGLAELLAGWVLGYLIDPDLPVGGIIASGSLDMRTMNTVFASPEALLINVTTTNMVKRLYGIEIIPINSYTDCKVPGINATFQKMYGLLCAPFSKIHSIGTDGLLSAGQDYSPIQHILDNEMNKAIERFWGHFEVNDDTLAIEELEEVIKNNTTFLIQRHTLKHFKDEHWFPRWLDRSAWRGSEIEAETERDMLYRIDHYCQEAIRRYEQPEIDKLKIHELERIYINAEKKLLV